MNREKVDPARVAAAAERAGETVAAVRTEVASLLTELTSIEGLARGGAALALDGVAQQWRATQVQVEVALDDVARALADAVEALQTSQAAASPTHSR